MNTLTIIGLVGKKSTGKDTIFTMLSAKHPCITRYAFADAVKEELAAACVTTVDAIEKKKDLYRPALQWWGTEFRQHIMGDRDYWVRKLLNKINRDTNNGRQVCAVITDVRFQHEAYAIHQLGGVLVKVINDTPNKDTHASEVEVDSINTDHAISNTGTLDDLQTKVNYLYDTYICRRIGGVPTTSK